MPLPEAVALAKIFGDATNEESRLLAGGMKNPREHRSGRGLAVSAADDDGMFAGKKNFFENFRHRAVRNFAFERFFEFGIAARDDVANDDQIRRRREMRRVEGWKIRNAEAVQQRGRRRIDTGVGAGDAEAVFAQHSGERRHGRASDADDVNMFLVWTGVPESCDDRRFENFERAFAFGGQPRADAKRQSSAWDERCGRPARRKQWECRVDREFARKHREPIGLPATGGSQSGKIAEHDAANLGEFSGVFQVHQYAVDLIRLHGAIFEKQDGAIGCRVPTECQAWLRASVMRRRAEFLPQNLPLRDSPCSGMVQPPRTFWSARYRNDDSVVAARLTGTVVRVQRRAWGRRILSSDVFARDKSAEW